MNLHSFAFLYVVPLGLELLLHLLPHKQVLAVKFLDSVLRVLLENVIAECFLDFFGFLHQKSQISVGNFCFVHAPIFLDTGCRKYWPFLTFEHQTWNGDATGDLIFVTYTVEQFLICWLAAEVDITEA
jgi:hypothetical protein